MKKGLSVILVFTIILSALITVEAAQSPAITVSSVTAMPGDMVELTVDISNNPGINTFSLGFSYDEKRLELKNVELSPNLDGQFVYKKKAVWLNSSDTTYNGDILRLKFKVLNEAAYGSASVTVTYSTGDISNYNEDDMYFSNVPGEITVGLSQSMLERIGAFLRRAIYFVRLLFSFF